MDVKMGTVESTQSSELGAISGHANSSSFHQRSPNVARLIHSESSSKMEYEFPISEGPSNTSAHHHHAVGTSNHSVIPSNNTRHGHSSSQQMSSSNISQQLNPGGHLLATDETRRQLKIPTNQSSSLWSSLASCFGCRTRGSNHSSMNPLRDKVHAIRIVRASNDLTPAVFDSHYNIITLEQLRECDNNGAGNIGSASNDSSDPLPSQNSNSDASAQNGNGSVVVSSSKKDNNHRMKKKKKKRTASGAYASKPTASDDDDEEESRRT